MPSDPEVDWDALRTAAAAAMARAYAPYSRFPVGAAALVDDGRVVTGCNVENASYGLGLCAECGLVSQLHLTGGGRLTHFVCVNGRGDLLMPCGRCRQLLWEQGGADLLLLTGAGVRPMRDLLPDAFGPESLEAARSKERLEGRPAERSAERLEGRPAERSAERLEADAGAADHDA